MPNISDKEIALANVYAGSIHKLAQEAAAADTLLREFQELSSVLEKDAELETFFSSPMVDPADRAASLEKMFRGRNSDLFVDSLQVINRKGRLDLVRSITQAFLAAYEEACGQVEVHVTTAVPLSEVLRISLTDAAREQAGKEPILVETVDPNVIGGLVVRIGDTKLDMSVTSRMAKIDKALIQRASHEIHGGRTYMTA